MAQEVGGQEYGTQEPEQRGPRARSSIWPWIVLAVVILVVILLLWMYWRQPEPTSVTVIKKTTEIPIVVPEPRPEPVVPSVVVTSTETTASTRLVPDVLGRPKGNAVSALEGAGYSVSSSQVYSTSKASGFVVEQNPAGGVPLDQGGTVAITVSVGTQTVNDVLMPEVVGLTQASAESKVKAAGLVPTILYGAVGKTAGTVISQWPLGGESLPAGSEGFIQIQITP